MSNQPLRRPVLLTPTRRFRRVPLRRKASRIPKVTGRGIVVDAAVGDAAVAAVLHSREHRGRKLVAAGLSSNMAEVAIREGNGEGGDAAANETGPACPSRRK